MATTVKIICKYYQIREYKDNDITQNTYNLIPWLNQISTLSLEERYKNNNGIEGRLEDIAKISESDIYALNFMRLDNVSTTYKVKKDMPAEHIDIEVGEYIAKNTVCIYDSVNNIMMIQSNRGGYADASIESYVNCFMDSKRCVLLPIREKIDITDSKTEYMKIDVRFANIREYSPISGSCFEEIISGMNKTEGTAGHIEISLGNNRKSKLNKNVIGKTISDLHHNMGCISSAKIKFSDDQISGIYDLFDNLCKDEVIVSIRDTDKGGITFDNLANKMFSRYHSISSERVNRAILNS